MLCGCRAEPPGAAQVGNPAQEPEAIETPAQRALGVKLHGSVIAATGMFGGGPEFSDAELKSLMAELPQGVTKLDLKMTKVSDGGLAALRGANTITEIYLPAQITDAGLEHVAGAKNLTFVILEDAKVSGTGLSHLKALPNLKRLFLNGAAVTDSGLASMVGLDALEELDLTGARITDAALAHLMHLPRLKSLDVSGTQTTRQAVAAFQQARPEVVVNGP